MKKAINNIILIVLFAGLLCGCGEGSGASDAVQDISKVESQEISAGAGNILDPFAVMNLSLKDNSLDAYSAGGRRCNRKSWRMREGAWRILFWESQEPIISKNMSFQQQLNPGMRFYL